jgi:hypothetical protein
LVKKGRPVGLAEPSESAAGQNIANAICRSPSVNSISFKPTGYGGSAAAMPEEANREARRSANRAWRKQSPDSN